MICRAGLVVLLCTVSSASASGSFDAGAIRIELANGHEADCVEEVTGLCAASTSGRSASDLRVDARQRIKYVIIAVNDSLIEERTGLELLPDRALVLDSSTLYREHDGMKVLAKYVGNRTATTAYGEYGLLWSYHERGVLMPWAYRNGTDIHLGVHRLTGGGDGGTWLGWERLGPFPTYNLTHTTVHEEVSSVDGCGGAVQPDLCVVEPAPYSAVARHLLPDAAFALEFEEAVLGDLDAHAQAAGTIGERAAVTEAGARSALRLPRGALTPEPPQQGLPGENVSSGPLREPGQTSTLPSASVPGPGVQPMQPPVGDDGPLAPAIVATAAALSLALLATLLYSRITKRNAAQAGPRQQILAALQDGPARLASLAERLALDRTTVEHHVRILARTGHVTLARVGRALVIALPGQRAEEAIRSGPQRAEEAVMRALAAANGALERGALHAQLADVPHRTRNHAIMTLARKGLLRSEWDGRTETVRTVARDGAGA